MLQVRQRIRSELVRLAWIVTTAGDHLDSLDVWVGMFLSDELDDCRDGLEEPHEICNLVLELHNQRDAMSEDRLDCILKVMVSQRFTDCNS